jgi:uroporphyrinogen III methyltransferase/synthase
MLIIGAVVGLREHLRWFDARPLFGRRIVVTRSREQAGELVDMLEERGAEAIQAPTIRIAPPEDLAALDRACVEAAPTTGSSSRARTPVDYFMQRVIANGDVRDLKGRPPVRDRTVDGAARRALRPARRPDAGRGENRKRSSRRSRPPAT